jgi:capsular polysaccharide biosynthesis protein
MQLQDYARILWRRGWIILLLALVAAASAYGFSRIQEARHPIYKSTLKILVQPARSDFGQAQAAKMLLRSYVAWMDSNYRAQDVIDALELDMLPEELRSDVKIASDDSRLVIQIDVENPSGDVSNDIARTWADLFVQWRNEENQKVRSEDRIDAIIIDDPRYVLDRPKTKINTLAGAILGGLIGGAIVFGLEYVEAGIVRSPQDVERYLNMTVLGVIPESAAAEG